MGAKFTIILDTDDTQGLKDALEVATLLHKRHVGRPHGVGQDPHDQAGSNDCPQDRDGRDGQQSAGLQATGGQPVARHGGRARRCWIRSQK